MKTALITSISGQDSIELSTYLLNNNYKVYCMGRRSARPMPRAVINLIDTFGDRYIHLNGDITDMSSIITAIEIAKPSEFYNLAAQSHVGLSFKEPISTVQITGLGTLNCLEAIRKVDSSIRFYQASSSEQFGGVKSSDDGWLDVGLLENGVPFMVITEETPFRPRSPYACAKVLAHNMVVNYREAYSLHASCGVLFNHEGVHRKPEFVSRKVTIAATEISLGIRNKLHLGTLNFARDWGYAGDYIRAMHLMLQQPTPGDYIIATGKAYTAQQLLETAFGHYNLDWKKYVEIDEQFSRPSDVRVLIGDYTNAKCRLGFEHSISFQEMIKKMCDHDMQTYQTYGEILE